jgi:Stress responsive A/B Barrel Domain
MMEEEMGSVYNRVAQILVGAALFVSGIAAGSLHARGAAVQNRFGQPKTVLHVVVYKFRNDVSNYDREKAINGIKDMAGKIPGIKNVWLKTERNQIRDFSGVYAIEFTSAEAAADYAESPIHEAWSKTWQQQRENSLSFQVSNP